MAELSDILTTQDYERPRRSEELWDWWRRVDAEISQWAACHSQTREDRTAQYDEINMGLTHKFCHDAFPISYFAHKFYKHVEDARFLLSAGSQQYDAAIIDQTNEIIRKIEVTNAIQGQIWALQKELLAEDGVAPMEENILGVKGAKSKKKRTTADIEICNEAHDTRERVDKVLQLTKSAGSEKTKKSIEAGAPYGVKQTLLIVTFDDTGFDQFEQKVFQFKRDEIDSLEHNFDEILLFGWLTRRFYR